MRLYLLELLIRCRGVGEVLKRGVEGEGGNFNRKMVMEGVDTRDQVVPC